MKLTMDAILLAQNNRCVDAARNGGIGRRARLRKPLRLPPEVWDDIRDVTTQLQRSFPDRYVTLNSTVEFLVAIATGILIYFIREPTSRPDLLLTRSW